LKNSGTLNNLWIIQNNGIIDNQEGIINNNHGITTNNGLIKNIGGVLDSDNRIILGSGIFTGHNLDSSINPTAGITPLKQFKYGISFDKIECRDDLVLVQKYDNSPACVKPETVSEIFERNWLPSQKLWNEVKCQDVFPNAKEFSQIVRTKTDTLQEASDFCA